MSDYGVEYGLNIANIVAGMSGGICSALGLPQKSVAQIISSTIVGGLTANYVTPVAAGMAGINNTGFIAFAIGLTGMIVCLKLIDVVKAKIAQSNGGKDDGKQ